MHEKRWKEGSPFCFQRTNAWPTNTKGIAGRSEIFSWWCDHLQHTKVRVIVYLHTSLLKSHEYTSQKLFTGIYLIGAATGPERAISNKWIPGQLDRLQDSHPIAIDWCSEKQIAFRIGLFPFLTTRLLCVKAQITFKHPLPLQQIIKTSTKK
jgi:hypothetical protein